jgi:predicted TIM-barrel fold metal-dependent hydrolase
MGSNSGRRELTSRVKEQRDAQHHEESEGTMGLPADAKLISVDDHIIEPPNLWSDRLPAKYRDVGPHVIEIEDGRQAWVYEDEIVQLNAANVQVLPEVDRSTLPRASARFDEMRPGCFDPKARLVDMDRDGVWASLCFPDYARFAGHRFVFGQDKELSLLCTQAYNDFVLNEWCATDPSRLLPMIILPFWDVDLSVREVNRLADQGVRAVAFSENPTVMQLPSIHTGHWDPLWKVIEERDLAVCMHIGSSSHLITSSEDAPAAVKVALLGVNSMVSFADWLFSGVLDRFPRLKVIFSEGGAGWVPYILERAEKMWTIYGTDSGASRPPTEIYNDNISVCMVTDAFAMQTIEHIGIGNLLWESDYPHQDGMFPESRSTLERGLKTFSDLDALRVGRDNAAAVFGIKAA